MWLLFVVALAVGLYLFFTWHFNYWKKRGVLYEKPMLVFGNLGSLFTFKNNIGNLLMDLYSKGEGRDAIGIWVFRKPALVIRNPEIVRAVIVKDFQNFRDRTMYSDSKADPLGSNNLFSIKNPHWRFLRVKLSPVFTSGKMKNMFGLIEKAGSDLDAYIDRHLFANKNIFETRELCAKLTTDTTTSVAYGVEANSFTDENSTFRSLGRKIFTFDWRRSLDFTSIFFIPELARIFKIQFFSAECSDILRKLFWKVLNEREANPVQRHDLINILLDLKNELVDDKNELKFEGDTLVAQASVFFTGGFETTSNTMSFTLYELAKNPEIQERLHREIKEAADAHGGKIIYESLQNLTYLEMCIKETLRMYPALPFLDRVCKNAYEMPGPEKIKIEANTFVYVPLKALQMDPRYFPNPEVYDPERFSPENIENIVPFTYIPFGEGPRNCIGQRFGLLQSKYGVARMLHKYKLERCPLTPSKLQLDMKSFLTAPAKDIQIKITKRNI